MAETTVDREAAKKAAAEKYGKGEAMYAWGREGMGKSVYEASKDRFRELFDSYDHVIVMFSGGKDSMVTMEVALEVAKERDKLPLTVFYSDDEAVASTTDEYIERVRAREGIDFHLIAMPFKQRNAASSSEIAEWYPWGREERDKWIRPMPEGAITLEDVQDWYQDPLGLDGKAGGDPADRPTFQQFMTYYALNVFPKGRIAQAIGLRAGESLVRRKSISTLRKDNWIIKEFKRLDKVYPIYDWSVTDIWTATGQLGWDYNEMYDLMEMRGVPAAEQRIGTPMGGEAIRDLAEWAESQPELWDKMVDRIPGAATAARYSRTELYSFKDAPEKPEGLTWIQFLRQIVDSHDAEGFRTSTYGKLDQMIKRHYRQTSDPILEYPHPRTGCSWKLLARVASNGDAKDRLSAMARRGIPHRYEEELQKYRQEARNARRKK